MRISQASGSAAASRGWLLALGLGVGSVVTLPGTLLSQEFCLRPRPECTWSMITEFTSVVPVASQTGWRDWLLGGGLGLTRRAGSRYRLGFLAGYEFSEPGPEHFVARLYGSADLTQSITVDLSPGVLKGSAYVVEVSREQIDQDGWIQKTAHPDFGITVEAAVSWRSWLYLTVRADHYRYDTVSEGLRFPEGGSHLGSFRESGGVTDLFAGLRFTETPGLVLSLAVPAVIGGWWLAFLVSGGAD